MESTSSIKKQAKAVEVPTDDYQYDPMDTHNRIRENMKYQQGVAGKLETIDIADVELDALTVAQLKELAEANEIGLGKAKKKDDIIEVILNTLEGKDVSELLDDTSDMVAVDKSTGQPLPADPAPSE